MTSSKRVMKHEWTDNGIPFYRAREIVSFDKGNLLKDPIFISEQTYNEKIAISGKPKKGDILITGVGTLGVTYIVPNNSKFYFKDGNVVWLKTLDNINSEFISFLFKTSWIIGIINQTNSTTVGTLTIDKVRTIPVNLPPIVEQQRIVNKLNQVSQSLDLLD